MKISNRSITLKDEVKIKLKYNVTRNPKKKNKL